MGVVLSPFREVPEKKKKKKKLEHKKETRAAKPCSLSEEEIGLLKWCFSLKNRPPNMTGFIHSEIIYLSAYLTIL